MQNTYTQNGLNFQVLFEAMPGSFLVLKPDTPRYTILGASNTYLKTTRTERNKIYGCSLFDVFPDRQNGNASDTTNNLRRSLDLTLQNKIPDSLILQKYHLQRPVSEGGGCEERYWNQLNTPVLNENQEVIYVIHRLEDVTEFIGSQNKDIEEVNTGRAEIQGQSVFIKNNHQKINTILDVLLKYTSLDFPKQLLLDKKIDGLSAITNLLNILRKELQNHIRQIEDASSQLESVIESYKDVLIFSINKNYEYLIFNTAFKEATREAYGTEITAGMNMLSSIKDEADRQKAKDNCDIAFAGKAHATLEVYGNINRNFFETKYNPILDERGNVVAVTIMSANVTERKRAEEQLLELNKELESFSYYVSHDLRAPLRAVDGYAKILEEDFSKNLGAEGNRFIEIILYNTKKMANLIDNLLAFSRIGKKEIRKIDLNMNELVEAALYEINKHTSHQASVSIEKLHSSKGDYGLINQVVVNLLSNAIKYSSKTEKPVVTISSEIKNDRVIYTVKDNGVGFDMKYIDKLFGVFQRLHNTDEFEGTGVGLAIVQKIMEKHGGEVFAEAQINKGATFKFLLPIN